MRRVPFDRLHTVCLTYESRAGYTEICREPDGTRWIRLCIRSDACQRELLSGLDESVPVRLESGVLEVLLPCHEGISLRQWLYEQKPDLSRRRDACLSLLEQLVEGNVPPCLIALSANTENLTLGMCSSLSNPTVASATAAALGVLTPMPCVPVPAGPWLNPVPKVSIGGQSAISNDSKLMCAWGGQIAVQFAGQTSVQL